MTVITASPQRRSFLDRFPFLPFGRCVSQTRAELAFGALLATSCEPQAPAPGCVPFQFPDAGSLGRAHEMCRLLIAMGLKPKKVWIQGALVAATRNHPDCAVHLNINVAPTLCVRKARSLSTTQMVLDPALFTTPVTQAVWKAAHSDDNATLTATNATIYDLLQGLTDPSNELSDQDLESARVALRDRSGQEGPPPYVGCP